MNDDIHQPPRTVPTIHIAQAPPEEKHHTPTPHHEPPKTPKQGGHRFKQFLKEKLTKKEIIIGAIVFVIVLGVALALGFGKQAAAPQSPPVAQKKAAPPQPTVYTSPLTGMVVTQAESEMPVTGVMIENSDFARPQSGLKEAGVVFEAIAEGGITRFLALSQETSAPNIGPIRSARPYFLQWALGFDAPVAHVGGSPEALQDIKSWGVKDLDEFYNGNYYHRISTREAPHNMYTSMAQLNALEKTKGWTSSTYTGFPRKQDSPVATPTAKTIDFSISGPDFSVHYDYTASTNSYARSEGGAPHMDATSGTQLSPKVVVALVMPYSLESDGYHSDYNTIGSGKAYIFQDGTVSIGNWNKPSMKDQFTFTDSNGKTIKLNAGQTWISAVGAASDVSYKP